MNIIFSREHCEMKNSFLVLFDKYSNIHTHKLCLKSTCVCLTFKAFKFMATDYLFNDYVLQPSAKCMIVYFLDKNHTLRLA